MALNLEATLPDPSLKTSAGANRFVWDMKHSAVRKSTTGGRAVAGPMVAPGKYRIELQVLDQNFTQDVQVVTDPRVTAAGVSDGDLKIQETLVLGVRDLYSEARGLENLVHLRRSANKEKIDSGKASKRLVAEDKALQGLEAQLTTAEGRYMKPMLVDQVSYLYFMLTMADQLPGQDAYDRFNELSLFYNGLKTANEKLIGNISKK